MIDMPITLSDAAEALREGWITSLQLTQHALDLTERVDPQLGTYLARFDASALERAEQADDEIKDGHYLGPLHGIPMAVKDILATKDGPTTAQSLVLDPAWGRGRDAPAVARLRAAGAVITGKTTTMEFAYGMPDPAKPFPLPRNPWDLDRWTGGSSSGTASGVARGMFYAGLGTDTGGSIRIPAAFCGITGLMPTFGRVPKSGCVPLGYSLDRIGPMARSARDCALLLEVIAGRHDSDPDSVDTSYAAGEFDGDLQNLRIGVVRRPGSEVHDANLDELFDSALDVLSGRGATLVEVTVPYWREMITVDVITMGSEALAYHRQDLVSRWDDYLVSTRALIVTGAHISGADFVQAQRVRRVAQDAIARLFDDVDVVVMPTAPTGAPRCDELTGPDGLPDIGAMYSRTNTAYWNPLGNPVLVVPMGFSTDGMPLSLQLASAAFDENSILRVGESFQRSTDWHRRIPDLAAVCADE